MNETVKRQFADTEVIDGKTPTFTKASRWLLAAGFVVIAFVSFLERIDEESVQPSLDSKNHTVDDRAFPDVRTVAAPVAHAPLPSIDVVRNDGMESIATIQLVSRTVESGTQLHDTPPGGFRVIDALQTSNDVAAFEPAPSLRSSNRPAKNRWRGRSTRANAGLETVHEQLPLLRQMLEEVDVLEEDAPLKPIWIAIQFERLRTSIITLPSQKGPTSEAYDEHEDALPNAFEMFRDLANGRLPRSKENLLQMLHTMHES